MIPTDTEGDAGSADSLCNRLHNNANRIAFYAEAAKSPVTTDREKAAAELINRYTAWAAAAGVIPVPFVDALAVGGVQLKMLRDLAAVFEVEFTENRGKSIIAALVGALGPASAAPVATSALKFIPGVGTAIASISMPALSAGTALTPRIVS